MARRSEAARVLRAAALAAMAALTSAASCDDIGSGDQPGLHTVRVSLDSAGKESTGPAVGSTLASLSDDGRFVAFQSDATGLVNGDGNNRLDIFVKDRAGGGTELVSFNSTTLAPSFGNSDNASISADGRWVAFTSFGGLAPGAGVTKHHIYVHDRLNKVTRRLLDPAIDPNFIVAVPGFFNPTISADGSKVAFASTATNLKAGLTVALTQVYVADMTTNPATLTLVSHVAGDPVTGASGASTNPRISADGTKIVFQSTAGNLAGATGATVAVFMGTSAGADCEIVSRTSGGASANGNNTLPSVSSDGRYVAFMTDSTGIAPGGLIVAAVRDRTAATTTVASLDATGTPISADGPMISGEGSRVAFVAPPTGGAGFLQIWVRDLAASSSSIVSVHLTGAMADADCFAPVFSVDGSWVGWQTQATNLVTSDTNGQSDIFVRGPLNR